MPALVILSEAKNLIVPGIYAFKILRLTPQNDVVGQPLIPDSSPEVQIYKECQNGPCFARLGGPNRIARRVERRASGESLFRYALGAMRHEDFHREHS
jgi:hypothetical protein